MTRGPRLAARRVAGWDWSCRSCGENLTAATKVDLRAARAAHLRACPVLVSEAEVVGPLADYLEWMRVKGCTAETLRTVRTTLLRLERFAERPLLNVTHAQAYAWQVSLTGRLQPDSVRASLSVVRGFFRWAVREELLDVDPTARLVMPKKPRRLPRPIRADRLAAALLAAPMDVRTALMLAAYAGLRSVEVSRLDWRDVDLPGGTLRVVGKGNAERVIPLAAPLLLTLVELPDRAGPVVRRRDGRPGQVHPTRVSQMANRWLRGQGTSDTFHSLRHYFATTLYRHTRDLRIVQRALGHASITNTEVYAQMDDDAVRAAIAGAFGGAQ